MATHRSLKLVIAVSVAGLAAGTSFAWAGVLVGGHRADHIGTFAPTVSRPLVPTTSQAVPVPPTAASTRSATATETLTTPTTDDGRSGDD
jgi:hypothetical protein